MPRPGPRPYECIRRSWHSDKLQPIRGSVIQEIFKVVSETHSGTTKKNKEWQEKLPIVVLKAEEIMFFKANSEGEYKDLKTLMDRLNDAINTIIRRDESESGDCLLPCIEAALVLGCTPRRATRSQRNINPKGYLSHNTQEESTSLLPHTDSSSPIQPPICRSPTVTLQLPYVSNGQRSEFGNHYNNLTTSHEFSHSSHQVSSPVNQCRIPAEAYPSSPNCAIYPLYYPAKRQCTDLPDGFQARQNSISNAVICLGNPVVGFPSTQSNLKPMEKSLLQNLFSPDASLNVSVVRQPDSFGPLDGECDLALRL